MLARSTSSPSRGSAVAAAEAAAGCLRLLGREVAAGVAEEAEHRSRTAGAREGAPGERLMMEAVVAAAR